MNSKRSTVAAGSLAVALVLGACGDSDTTTAADATSSTSVGPVIDPGDGGSYRPEIDPASFVDVIDNPYLPLRPGARWVYEGRDDDEVERIEVVVTDERREVFGISATVVRDTVTVDGELVEDTYDWFAQDADGNVWYLGEDTAEYENGEVKDRHGSWEAGVDGALPGIVMPARPEVGRSYRQEYYAGEAEDLAEIVRMNDEAAVPFGTYDDVVVIKEWNPFEPDVTEEKYYTSGVGLLLEVKTAGGDGRVELVEHVPGA
jgi:hypothetical protein